MTQYLITGASGNLGRPLSTLASMIADTTSLYHRNPAVGGGQPVQADIRDSGAVMSLVAMLRPEVIIHAAASERSDDMAATNQNGALNICQAASKVGARLVALSSDLVFDGAAPPYTEESPPTPLSPYGCVKAEIERLLTASYDNCLVVRTSLIYDAHPANRQAQWLEHEINNRKRVALFVDEIRQPVWAWNLAAMLLELARMPVTGILNVAGPQSLSRWEYGCTLLRALGYDPDDVAYPVLAAQVAPGRPRDCTLTLDRARSILKTPFLDLNQALSLAQQSNPARLASLVAPTVTREAQPDE